jgi:MFS transporter, MCT family, solute carrier family 16 (monocarboxylic acid transporters), member 3
MSTTVTETEIQLSTLTRPISASGKTKESASTSVTLPTAPNYASSTGLVLSTGQGRQSPSFYDRSDPEGDAADNVTDAIPDGGYGWAIVASCAALNFCSTGFVSCWGVLQTALLQSDLDAVPASTAAWVGSVGLGISVIFGLPAVRCLPLIGARNLSLLGSILLSIGMFGCGFSTTSVHGLFVTYGVLAGLGMAILIVVTNTMPTQYFNGSLGGKLGLANGIIKLGGGIGAAVLSVMLEAMNRRLGIGWTFRIAGILSFCVSITASWFMRERGPLRKYPLVDWSMFKNIPYLAFFLSGAISVFGLYIPAFYLPMFAQAIGLSSSTGAGIVAGFNLSAAIGRFGAGPMCDWLGASNTLLITMSLLTISTMAIWPASSSIGPLIIFAVVNGIANGAFYTSMPTVYTSLMGPGRAAVAMGMANAGWTFGFLLGPPIAGYLLPNKEGPQSVEGYRPIIFYAGGIAVFSCCLVILARLKLSGKLIKKT